jgi:hypothetical protein
MYPSAVLDNLVVVLPLDHLEVLTQFLHLLNGIAVAYVALVTRRTVVVVFPVVGQTNTTGLYIPAVAVIEPKHIAVAVGDLLRRARKSE